MLKTKTCGSDCSKPKLIQSFLEGNELPSELLLSCNECFREFASLEEVMISLIRVETSANLNGPTAPEFEKIDLAKAESLLDGKLGHELPDFLKHYTKVNLTTAEKKDVLIVKLSAKGVQLLNGLLSTVRGKESYSLMPALRSTLDTLPEHQSCVIFEETTIDDQTFYYQIVKENADQAYLTVKAETKVRGIFHQVNLRKDGRFILSNQVGLDGIASFSGLAPGDYMIEFQGENFSKSFDLCLLVE